MTLRIDFAALTIHKAATAPYRVDRERAAAKVRWMEMTGRKLSPLALKLLDDWKTGKLRPVRVRPTSRPLKREPMLIVAREWQIRITFDALRADRGMNAAAARQELAREFCVSEATIRSILYRPRRVPPIRLARSIAGAFVVD